MHTEIDVFDNIFVECFGKLSDKRYKNKQHRLIDIVAICVCGILSGMANFVEIYDFALAHEKWFKKYLLLPNGIPSHDTINAVISTIKPGAFSESFLEWINKLKNLLPENVIPIDGKTLRCSNNKKRGLKALHIVNAYSCANGLTLGQIAVEEKSNEITAIPKLLNTLAIKGAIITIDAMGTQKEIAKQIIDNEADYVLAVKENQKGLSEAIVDIFELSKNKIFNENLKPSNYKFEITGEHGRIEDRIIYALPAEKIKTQINLSDWKNIKSVIKVEHINWITDTTELRFYISSIEHAETETIAKAIRLHWNIENNLHWVLDVIFKEDHSCIRNKNTAQNMSWLRKMAIYLLKQDQTKGSMRTKMIRNCINPNNIISLLRKI